MEWARPLLRDSYKLERIMDPRLEDQYSPEGAKRFAALAYQCLSHHAKGRPTMRTVVRTLESLLKLKDIPVGPFVYVVPSEEDKDILKVNEKVTENDHVVQINQIDELKPKEEEKGEKKEKGHHRQRKSRRHKRRVKPVRSQPVYSDTALYKTLGTNLYSPKQAT